MPFTQLTLTNVGKREMLKQGELVVTGMAVGNGSTNAENATSLAAQFVRKVPTVTNEGDKKVVEIVLDNKELDNTRRKAMSEIGIFAKVGNGPEFLWLYGGNTADPPVLEDYRVQRIQMTIRYLVSVSSDKNITVTLVDDRTSYASVNSVNRVSETLGKLKSGTSIEQALDLPGLKVLLGSTGKQRAPQDLDTLGTPGIYWYEQSHNTSSKGIASGYGFILVFSNMVGNPGQAGNFTWQVFYGTNGRIWVRTRVNTGAWSVQPVASGEYLTNTLKRLGLDEWGFGFNTATCSSGTNFGTFLGSSAVPIGFNIVKDNNVPAKTVYVWKQSNTIASCFAMTDNRSFLTATLNSGRLSEWRDLSQPIAPLVSTGQFATYLRSNAVPVGSVPVKDSTTGAFGTVTKIDNNNVFFTGAMRKQGKTYQVEFAIVDGIVPSAFTEWKLT